ncbi:MAG TPA: cyclic nucleotide-binding domain-containing protein [Acidobacteriota bacterium]|nr:cyclic nucleotide-binding domain-containing protein [Acidobacteriota bacterium]
MSESMDHLRREYPSPAVTGVNPLLLGNCSHLNDLSTKALVGLSKLGECRLVHEEECLFAQGDRADSVYLLLDGSLRMERFEEAGGHASYDIVAPYASFGDIVLLGEELRRYSATAAEDSVVLELPLLPLVRVLSANPPQALAWRGAVMARLHRLEPQQAGHFAWKILDKIAGLFDAA